MNCTVALVTYALNVVLSSTAFSTMLHSMVLFVHCQCLRYQWSFCHRGHFTGTSAAAEEAAAVLEGDASEPRYCICKGVSYGDMVCCDNDDCPIEWFHFPCVGLTEQPKGKWYCPTCTKEMALQHGHHHGHAQKAS